MRSLHFSRIFKILCSHRTVKLTYTPAETNLNVAKRRVSYNFSSSEMNEALLVIKKYPFPVPWEQVTKVLAEHNEDVTKVIIKSCLELKDADLMMSFYKYVKDNGGNLNQINLFMIVKTLSLCSPEKILEYEHLLMHLFNECKGFMSDSEIFQTFGVQVFSYFPHCYKEIVAFSKNFDFLKRDFMIIRAFDFDDVSTAWELLEKSNSILSELILNSFINYCIRQALQNKFSINLIQTLVDLCQRKGFIITSSDILCSLQPLVNVLMHCQNEYIWSVKKCTVNDQMECLNCNTTLKESKISESEFQALKNAVIKALIPQKDVFLKTSHSELNRFNNFLETCRPYDLVIDGLNLIYRGVYTNKRNMIMYLLANYVKQTNRKPLIILRKHFKKDKFLDILPAAQFFFTENSSDDDVFLLYAAMYGGLGTVILTSDFLVTHAAKLDAEMKTIFIKWQIYHQYIMDGKLGIIHPRLHLGLPQCTDSLDAGGDSYKWHLSYQEKNISHYSFRVNFDWLCLQAIPKK